MQQNILNKILDSFLLCKFMSQLFSLTKKTSWCIIFHSHLAPVWINIVWWKYMDIPSEQLKWNNQNYMLTGWWTFQQSLESQFSHIPLWYWWAKHWNCPHLMLVSTITYHTCIIKVFYSVALLLKVMINWDCVFCLVVVNKKRLQDEQTSCVPYMGPCGIGLFILFILVIIFPTHNQLPL